MDVEFAPRIEGDFEYDIDENGNKVIKEIKNLNIISIDFIQQW